MARAAADGQTLLFAGSNNLTLASILRKDLRYGVRDFAPAIEQLDAQTLGFPEVDRLAAGCKFQDCKHMQEPACAVMNAVEKGEFSARRYESYRRLRRRYSDLVEARGPAQRNRR